ncbi:heparan sulfate 2-O-sulfotransferase pipe-like isoform X2 [Drosophila sulfurigaster albostrigata]|uniref:heparan sulfate 2-O-sulfotransferase pipe-like isoform X2 n=1 Tax=Drosophila sulfurigaster albostrigata TaxID=89887 RepID=UPI002D21DFA3|nr:heparan sulfate 2-O-sulfotransferase pipe-like isoform X2 [Drosophila sulfurigaster albostrigata]
MSVNTDRSYKMKLRDVENAFKYRRIPYPKRSVELIALLAISCTFFLFMHTNKLNSRLKEMEVKLQPSEFSALGLTGNHISGHDAGKHDDINTLHGTYQYLKSTGQLQHLTSAQLNNTPHSKLDTLFFNRVPKTGSEKLMALLKLLAKRNSFEARRDSEQLLETILIDNGFARHLLDAEILNCSTPNSYTKHVAFVNFAEYQKPWPIYINLVRDPIERLISWFYYARAPWYLADRANTFGEAYKMPSSEWLQKDFNRCVSERDPECVYEQLEMGNLGDHRRQTLFFCGQNPKICMPFNSLEAMQRAKRNVEKRYAVVGTWEDTNTTLSVLETYIPQFFAGARDEYYAMQRQVENVNRNALRPTISEETRLLLSRNLTHEIEFYQFARQRLNKQYIAHHLERDRSVSG